MAPRSCRREASSVCATVGELQDLLGLVDATEVLSLHGDILPSERASAHVVGLVRRDLRFDVATLVRGTSIRRSSHIRCSRKVEASSKLRAAQATYYAEE